MALVELIAGDAVGMNAALRCELPDREPIALFNIDGDFFVTRDTCTHGAAALVEGDIEEHEVFCPFHRGAFNIRNSEATVAPCIQPLLTYATQVIDGIVFVEFES